MQKGEETWLLQRGEKILDWSVLRPLGRGGMAEVYLVERVSAPSYPYALKIFTARNGDTTFFKQRFLAIGEGLLQISHPALAKLLYVGLVSRNGTEHPFAVMPFIGMSEAACRALLSAADADGQEDLQPRTYSLADLLARPGGVSLTWLERWFREISAGLDHLHAAGFAHGDIKPTNILIDAAGHAILIDFGLATALPERKEPPGYELTQVAFQSASVFRGTPSYTAPELLAGGSPTPAGDRFSLGATFFYARTGVLFHPSAPMRLLIESMESPWRERFQQLLAGDPAARLTDPSADTPGKRQGAARCRRLRFAAAAAALLLPVAAGIWWQRDRLFSPCPVLQAEAGTLSELHLQAGETLHLKLGGRHTALTACTIPDTATLIVSGPGSLQIIRSEGVRFSGTLETRNLAEIRFSGHHLNTRPRIVTSRGTRITADVGVNRRSTNQFTSLDMSRGGTFTGEGIRFFLNHKEPYALTLGAGARLELPWVGSTGVIRACAVNPGESPETG